MNKHKNIKEHFKDISYIYPSSIKMIDKTHTYTQIHNYYINR